MKKNFSIATIVLILVVAPALLSSCKNNETKIGVAVPDYYAISEFYFDDDFGDFKEFYQDTYNWYKSIEDKDGVYLAHNACFDDDVLQAWRDYNVYDSVPDNAFWYFTVSPSYLKQMGVDVNAGEIEEAKNGVRLYLVPDTMADGEAKSMESFLKENAVYSASDSDIKTTFTENLEILIIKYMPNEKYFTFPSAQGEELEAAAPVIYICTSENMKYFESESLIATGVDSYIKFIDEATMQKYTADPSIDKYSLKFTRLSDIYSEASKHKRVDKGISAVFN